MEKDLKFSSAVCTSLVQSERLLALGLKKETADAKYPCTREYYGGILTEGTSSQPIIIDTEEDDITEYDIPAWSLHRLIKMMPESIHLDNFANTHYDRTLLPSKIIYMKYDHTWICQSDNQNDFDNCVDMIEWLIKEGYFNKEYLV